MLSLKRFFYLFVPLFVVFAVLVASPALARIVIDGYGQVQVSSGRVLSSSSGSGDDSSGSGSSGSGGSEESDDDNGNSSGSESGDSSSDSSTMKSPTPTPTKTETRSSDGTRTKTEVKKDGEVRTEVRLPDGTKIKTRAEEGRTRTDVYQGATKVRFEREGDRFRIKAENELGQEVKLEEREADELDEDADEIEDEIVVEERADLLRIRALQRKTIIERLNVQALTDLPLSVDLATNILTVTTPAGEKQVTVLPDQAVQNILAANVIDRLSGQALVDEVRQGNIQTLGQVIALGLRNNVPVYQVQGVKEHRFLGFFPVTTDVTVSVSAETGEVVDTDQSLGDRIIDIFSVTP
ncbi:MAG: hypothetical protein A3E36_02310 [Candidatus Andersenbacteria bacterium RIFCSPHIGHO2_12_FULL_45_11b]|uniref:Uncharacterized protein n=1 Tax=Candidatus Andersenbacteria bacterium RIFCSPHIGHO2_12_FULL_45_11b TaxID=1797282 RepID=A0A1G1XCI9_9BACT|nr:MAG: hypothetical protein A3E36_02310 [Candidatus Andersenbacteria bacterium RIFCSPHIGHO2_12_FULL_45_11b]